jgi:hypothetical protein
MQVVIVKTNYMDKLISVHKNFVAITYLETLSKRDILIGFREFEEKYIKYIFYFKNFI